MKKNTVIENSKGLLSAGVLCAALFLAVACSPKQPAKPESKPAEKAKVESKESAELTIPDESKEPKNAGYAILGAGCFWCVEEVLQQMDGVTAVVSGYAGGSEKDANYDAVCSGKTDHAEVVKVTFDKDKTSYDKVLDTFWKLHDPTTLNRQGPDAGRQYRSAIFYQNEEQKKIAEASKKKLDDAEIFPRAVVTQIVPLEKFYPAEDYHQNYARLHPDDDYIQGILVPKLKKLHLKVPK
ncbi:MAG: peptide-methionine (S)-S-oxide reductase MsrA [Verrucomicrobiales bacterium]|nr:peptide-methionine (S)-S-oxide reductase MsrA [Verrucomicrobiales bacterium]